MILSFLAALLGLWLLWWDYQFSVTARTWHSFRWWLAESFMVMLATALLTWWVAAVVRWLTS